MLPPTSRTIVPCAAMATTDDRALPLFESFIYVIIAGLLFALPIMIPLLHPSPAAADTVAVVAYADEIDVALAEAEDARRLAEGYLAVIGDDCVPSQLDDVSSATASLSRVSGVTTAPKHAGAPAAMTHCQEAGATSTD